MISKNIKIKIYKTIILPEVLYGCETWCLALSEAYRLSMFENRVLAEENIWTYEDEVIKHWRKGRTSSFVLLNRHYYNDEIKENEISRA
jgi:hypothetical protein